MSTYSRQVFSFLLLLFFSLNHIAWAQEGTVPLQTPQDQTAQTNVDSLAVVVADVSVSNLQFEEKDGVLVGSFTLRGNAGQQNNIVAGVLAIDNETGVVQDAAVLASDLQVHQGEIVTQPFSYRLPTHLSGKISLYIRVETVAGLPLGTLPILTRTFAGSGSSIQCAKDADSRSFSCSAMVAEDVLVTYHEGSPLGVLVGDKTVQVAAGKKFSPMIDQEPGQYVVVLRGVTTNSYVQFPVRVTGVFGRIRNVMMYEQEGGGSIIGTVSATVSGATGANVSAVFRGSSGSCGEATASVLGEVATFTIPASCKSGTVTIVLSDNLGKELDRSEQAFSIETAAQDLEHSAPQVSETPTVESSGSGISTGVIIAVTLGALGLLLSFLYVLRRKHMPTLIFLVTLLGSVPCITDTVSALTIGQTAFSGAVHDLDGNDWRCTYDVNTDKTTYTPGETMTISGSASCVGGVNIIQSNSGLSYNAPSASPSTPLFDTPSPLVAGAPSLVSHYDGLSAPTIYSFSSPFSRSVTVPATMVPGSHYLALRIASMVQAFSEPTGMSTGYRNLNFMVSASNNTPTANAGSDRTITLPTNSVTISGASETDSDGAIVSRVWAFESGPASPTITNGTTLTPTFSGMSTAGTYVFRLTVTDNGGATASDLVSVSVFSAAPSCGWATTDYLGAQASLHNSTRCSSPLPTMGSEPQASYCDSAAENGSTVVCCDSGADCYRYACNYGGSCTASVQLNFQ